MCGGGEILQISDGSKTEIGWQSMGVADVRGVVVASAGQGQATRSDTGGSEGEGLAGAASMLAMRSLVGVLCRMSQICCFVSGGNWAWVSG